MGGFLLFTLIAGVALRTAAGVMSCDGCTTYTRCEDVQHGFGYCDSCDVQLDCLELHSGLDDECATCGADCSSNERTALLRLDCDFYCTGMDDGSCVYNVLAVDCASSCIEVNVDSCQNLCEMGGCIYDSEGCTCNCDCSANQGGCVEGCHHRVCQEDGADGCRCVSCDVSDCETACEDGEGCKSSDGQTCTCGPCDCECIAPSVCMEVAGVCQCYPPSGCEDCTSILLCEPMTTDEANCKACDTQTACTTVQEDMDAECFTCGTNCAEHETSEHLGLECDVYCEEVDGECVFDASVECSECQMKHTSSCIIECDERGCNLDTNCRCYCECRDFEGGCNGSCIPGICMPGGADCACSPCSAVGNCGGTCGDSLCTSLDGIGCVCALCACDDGCDPDEICVVRGEGDCICAPRCHPGDCDECQGICEFDVVEEQCGCSYCEPCLDIKTCGIPDTDEYAHCSPCDPNAESDCNNLLPNLNEECGTCGLNCEEYSATENLRLACDTYCYVGRKTLTGEESCLYRTEAVDCETDCASVVADACSVECDRKGCVYSSTDCTCTCNCDLLEGDCYRGCENGVCQENPSNGCTCVRCSLEEHCGGECPERQACLSGSTDDPCTCGPCECDCAAGLACGSPDGESCVCTDCECEPECESGMTCNAVDGFCTCSVCGPDVDICHGCTGECVLNAEHTGCMCDLCSDCYASEECQSTATGSFEHCAHCDNNQGCSVPLDGLDEECMTCGPFCRGYEETSNLWLDCSVYCMRETNTEHCVYNPDAVPCENNCIPVLTDNCEADCGKRGCAYNPEDCGCQCDCTAFEGECHRGCVYGHLCVDDHRKGCVCAPCSQEDCGYLCDVGEACHAVDQRTCQCAPCVCLCGEGHYCESVDGACYCVNCSSIVDICDAHNCDSDCGPDPTGEHCVCDPEGCGRCVDAPQCEATDAGGFAHCTPCDGEKDCLELHSNMDEECATCGEKCNIYGRTANLWMECDIYCIHSPETSSCIFNDESVNCQRDCVAVNAMSCQVECDQMGCDYNPEHCSCDCDCSVGEGQCYRGCAYGTICKENYNGCQCYECDTELDCGGECALGQVCHSVDGLTCGCSLCACSCPWNSSCESVGGACSCVMECGPGVDACDYCHTDCYEDTEAMHCLCPYSSTEEATTVATATTEQTEATDCGSSPDSCNPACLPYESCIPGFRGDCECFVNCVCDPSQRDCICPQPQGKEEDPEADPSAASSAIASLLFAAMVIAVST